MIPLRMKPQTFTAKIESLGSSLGVRIPKEVRRELRLEEGDSVELTVRRSKDLFGSLKGIGPFTHDDRDHHD